MSKKRAFVLCSYAWEYNDEFYCTPEGSPVDTHAAYMNKDDADAMAELSNVKELKGLDLSQYCYDGWQGILAKTETIEAFTALMHKLGAVDFTDDSPDIPDGLPHKAYVEMLKHLELRFWVVHELPVK